MKRKIRNKSLNLAKELNRALEMYQNGNLNQAKNLYKKIIQNKPTHHHALQMIGIIYLRAGKKDNAISYMRRSIKSAPDRPDYLFNLARAYHNWGDFDDAIGIYQKYLQLNPKDHETLLWLARVWHDKKEHGKALEYYRQFLDLYPQRMDCLNGMGLAYDAQGDFDQAVKCYEQAISFSPNDYIVLNNLAVTFWKLKKFEEAVTLFQKTISLKPDYVLAHCNMGNMLKDQGKLDMAEASYRKALTIQPNYVEAHINLGNVLKGQGKLGEAETSLRQALALQPNYAEAHNNLGVVLRGQGKIGEAETSFRQAISLRGGYPEAHNNLGNVLKDLGKLDEAEASYRQALVLQSDNLEAYSNLLLILTYLPNSSISNLLDEARYFGEQISNKAKGRFQGWNSSDNPERLRVGLVSGDFGNHPVGYFLENILGHSDTTKIDFFAYPTYDRDDGLTTRIRPHFKYWKSLANKSDEEAANLIFNDKLHVLLDLAGHTCFNRAPVFAWKPAPVQASWLGYFASTGIKEMDYIITDPISVPESQREQFTEEVWELPDIRYCFSPPLLEQELQPTSLPALDNGYITFGCFQQLPKINDGVLECWGRIFQLLPEARLRIQNKQLHSQSACEEMRNRLVKHGISLNRVMLEKAVSRTEYFAAHASIDILLDTFPFSGGTTTCEAMWMGVPTVTLTGKTMVARQGASLMTCAGLSDWVAVDINDYVAKAVAHATELNNLTTLRTGLRQQVLSSPIFDGQRFVRNFETALRGMWQHYQDQK